MIAVFNGLNAGVCFFQTRTLAHRYNECSLARIAAAKSSYVTLPFAGARKKRVVHWKIDFLAIINGLDHRLLIGIIRVHKPRHPSNGRQMFYERNWKHGSVHNSLRIHGNQDIRLSYQV